MSTTRGQWISRSSAPGTQHPPCRGAYGCPQIRRGVRVVTCSASGRWGWFRRLGRPLSVPSGVALRRGVPEDLDAVTAVDAAAFGDPVDLNRPWIEPLLQSERCRVVVAEAEGALVGCATGTRSDGWAGPAVMVTGVAVVEPFRRRGIGAALTSALVDWAFDSGATLVHLNPDDDTAARLYAGLGFVEVPGFDVYVDV